MTAGGASRVSSPILARSSLGQYRRAELPSQAPFNDTAEQQAGEVWLRCTKCRQEPHRINWLHVNVERPTADRFHRDFPGLPVALFAFSTQHLYASHLCYLTQWQDLWRRVALRSHVA